MSTNVYDKNQIHVMSVKMLPAPKMKDDGMNHDDSMKHDDMKKDMNK